MILVTEFEGKTVCRAELAEYMKSFISGLEGNFKSVKIVRDTELEFSKKSPSGRCYLVQHDASMMML